MLYQWSFLVSSEESIHTLTNTINLTDKLHFSSLVSSALPVAGIEAVNVSHCYPIGKTSGHTCLIGQLVQANHIVRIGHSHVFPVWATYWFDDMLSITLLQWRQSCIALPWMNSLPHQDSGASWCMSGLMHSTSRNELIYHCHLRIQQPSWCMSGCLTNACTQVGSETPGLSC